MGGGGGGGGGVEATGVPQDRNGENVFVHQVGHSSYYFTAWNASL